MPNRTPNQRLRDIGINVEYARQKLTENLQFHQQSACASRGPGSRAKRASSGIRAPANQKRARCKIAREKQRHQLSPKKGLAGVSVYSNRQIVDACENRIDMIWLLVGEPVPDQSTIARFKQRCAAEIEDLFYQYARLLEKQGETDHEVVFIDGTKIESRAGRYTFCWRGTVEKNLAKVRQAVLEKTGLKTLRGLQKTI